MEKKHVILLTVIAIATLLITVVGATFAFFAATVDGNDKAQDTQITSAEKLSITYNDGDIISISNVIPGYGSTYALEGDEKTVVVTNDTDFDIEYKLKWSAVTNTFDNGEKDTKHNDQDNLVYSAEVSASKIDGEDDGETLLNNISEVKAPTSDSDENVFDTVTLKAHEKVTYTIKLKYKEADYDQKSQGAQFTGKITLSNNDIKVVSTQAQVAE